MSVALSCLAGVGLDVVLGEPRRGHPLVLFGQLADRLEAHFNGPDGRGWRSHGVTAWCLAVLPLTALAWLLSLLPGVGWVVEVLLLYIALGLRSLGEHLVPVALALRQGDLAEARRRFRQTAATSESLAAQVEARGADIVQARAQLATAQADLEKARIDLQRREALVDDGAVSGDEVTAARKTFASAQAALRLAQAGVKTAEATRGAATGQLEANQALVRGSTEDTDPAVMAAKARLDSAKLDLERTVIRAPIDGVITKRQVQVGQRVAQGSPIMTIVPLSQVYVDANFKERQLRDVRIGMPAEVKSDLYGGDVVYHGKVVGFSGGTGSSMSLIPAQNATGNWIKVVQRLPLRIELDPKELAAHPLRVGLSMEVEIDLAAD
mgnify:CR=1 FL=1